MKISSILLAILFSICCSCKSQKAKNEESKVTDLSNELTQNVELTQQKYPAVQLHGTEIRKVTSNIVEGMEYKLYISLPDNYETSTDIYPVLYFLDAWAQFGIIREAYWLLRFYDEVPPIIIVGIAYEGSAEDHVYYRARDYTPTKVPPETLGRLGDLTPVSGGAPTFVHFLEKELFPFIEQEYRANKSDRAVFGVSYGGLFATYALFEHTNLFKRYFIGSPPVWWDNEIIHKYEDDYARKNVSLPAKVFLAVGGTEDLTSYNKLRNRILSRKYKDLEFTSIVFEDETHMSVIPAAHTRALRVLYNRTK